MNQNYSAIFFITLVSAMLFNSCPAQNKMPANNVVKTDKATNINPFGVLVSAADNIAPTPAKSIQIAKSLGVPYIRYRVFLSEWNDSKSPYDMFISSGLKVLLNVNYSRTPKNGNKKSKVPFPTDLDDYKTRLTIVLNRYKPELTVIENEETSFTTHSGSAQEYINELKAAIEVAHKMNLKVTNGGLTSRVVTLLVWDDLFSRGMKKKQQVLHTVFFLVKFCRTCLILLILPSSLHSCKWAKNLLKLIPN